MGEDILTMGYSLGMVYGTEGEYYSVGEGQNSSLQFRVGGTQGRAFTKDFVHQVEKSNRKTKAIEGEECKKRPTMGSVHKEWKSVCL